MAIEQVLTIDDMVPTQAAKAKEITAKTAVEKQGPAYKQTLYTMTLGALSGGTRNTPEQVKLLGAYETALGVFRSASSELRRAMDILTLESRLGAREGTAIVAGTIEPDKDDELRTAYIDGIMLSNRYALHMAGRVGLALIGEQPRADMKAELQLGVKGEASIDVDAHTRVLSTLTTSDFAQVIAATRQNGAPMDDTVLRDALAAEFTSWANQFRYGTFKDVTERFGVDDMTVRFGAYSMRAGKFSEKSSRIIVDDRFMPARKADIIGGQDLTAVIEQAMIRLLGYDHERRENPLHPPSVIFSHGPPGCGKTFIAHATIQSMMDLARELGLSGWAETHSTVDYASHYQNLTANQLNDKGMRIRDFPGFTALYVADADVILTSRKGPNNSSEEQRTTGIYFKIFDGTLIPKQWGKFLTIMDANYVDSIDGATKDRLFDVIVSMDRFKTMEEFALYARRNLTKGVLKDPVNDAGWNDVGKYLLESGMSHRSIGHVLKQLRTGFTVEPDLLRKSFDEKKLYVQQYLGSFSAQSIIDKFEEYLKTRENIEKTADDGMTSEQLAEEIKEKATRWRAALAKEGKTVDSAAAVE